MNRRQAVVILQARRASTRLPDKVLAPIAGRSVLRHCIDRLRAASPVPVVLATTERPEDDVLVQEAHRAGILAYRGPEHDVLGRFVMVARALNASAIVRATADNPAVDIDAVPRVLNMLTSCHVDHVVEDLLPYGAAVEAVDVEALYRADRLATLAEDREHVTTLIKRDRSCFTALSTAAPVGLRRPDVRLTVDTREDLEFVRRLSAELGDPADEPSLRDYIRAADRVLQPVAVR